ncbi:MAG: hypothetical protein LBB16_03055 [Puniceicoccales bacterium]|jgi:hypothetical protein|nr:hypothetical protein [Puniceicoccales bacterium]
MLGGIGGHLTRMMTASRMLTEDFPGIDWLINHAGFTQEEKDRWNAMRAARK